MTPLALTLWLCAAAARADADVVLPPAAASLPAAGVEPAAPGWLDEPVGTAPRGANSRAGLVAGVLCGGAALLGMYALGRRGAAGRQGVGAQGRSIELLALKPLGGKQRLALVSVCGERLLLAANDREVTLLSHLPAPDGRAEAAEAAVEARAEAAQAVAPPPAQAAPAGATVAAMEAALQAADAAAATAPFAQDLAGLHLWKRELHAAEERA